MERVFVRALFTARLTVPAAPFCAALALSLLLTSRVVVKSKVHNFATSNQEVRVHASHAQISMLHITAMVALRSVELFPKQVRLIALRGVSEIYMFHHIWDGTSVQPVMSQSQTGTRVVMQLTYSTCIMMAHIMIGGAPATELALITVQTILHTFNCKVCMGQGRSGFARKHLAFKIQARNE